MFVKSLNQRLRVPRSALSGSELGARDVLVATTKQDRGGSSNRLGAQPDRSRETAPLRLNGSPPRGYCSARKEAARPTLLCGRLCRSGRCRGLATSRCELATGAPPRCRGWLRRPCGLDRCRVGPFDCAGLQINHPGVRAGSVRQLAGQPVHSRTATSRSGDVDRPWGSRRARPDVRARDDRLPGARRCRHHLHQVAGVRSWVRWAWAQSVKLRAGRLVTVVMSPVGSELNGSRVERNCSTTACASSSGVP